MLRITPLETPPFPDGASMWIAVVAIVTTTIVIIAVLVTILLLYRWRRKPPARLETNIPQTNQAAPPLEEKPLSDDAKKQALGNVVRSLAPTLMDDEKRIVDELARAGGELLQSDLPSLTDFSKATVSKAIHSLEVRGIVVREKHKWTYWCKLNPKLVERFGQPEPSTAEPTS